MELTGEHVLPGDRRREFHAVLGRGDGQTGIRRRHVVGMHEVDVRVVADPFELGDSAADAQTVPSHLRDLEALERGAAEAHDFARQDAESADRAELLALLEEQLQPEANAEERLAG